MSVKVCQNCNKGVMKGNNVTRARQELTYRSPKTFRPNLHTYKMSQEDGSRVKLTLCTKCLRMMKQFAAENAAVETK